MRKIIINADDFGLTDGICRAVADLFEKRAISNTSVMICVENAASRCREFLTSEFRRFAGVHLQLTPEEHHRKPLSPPKEIPTLVDDLGNFKPKGHTDWVNPEEVRLEWERQIIQVAEALGGTPSHLDSHHGVHRIPSLIPVCLELAQKYKLALRGGRELSEIDGARHGVWCSTLCDSSWTGQNQGAEALKEVIKTKLASLQPGVLELCTHPGFCDEELIRSSTWNTVRENDYAVLAELAGSGWLASEGITLERFQPLSPVEEAF